MDSVSRLKAALQNSEKRVPGIDLLRGLCIVAVVLHHINLRIHFRDSGFGQWIGPAANRALFWNGYYGVRVFFVISGFLITTWSLKRWGSLSQLNRRQFYLMRFARIVPCLVGLLLILAIFDLTGVPRFVINPQHTSLGRALLAALTFHVNWLEARTGYLPAAWDVLWSLSVEEVFYLFFPLLCALVRRQSLLIALLCCFLIVGPYARVHTSNELWADYGYLACMDGIALGCLAAMFSTKFRLSDKANLAHRIAGISLLLFIAVFRSLAARTALYKAGLDVTTLQIGTALLLVAMQQRYDRQALRDQVMVTSRNRLLNALSRSTSFLRWFGRNSYEVYLTHMLVVWPMVGLFFRFRQNINLAPWWFLAITALSGIAGHVVAVFYSEPLNHWLRSRSAEQKRAIVAAD